MNKILLLIGITLLPFLELRASIPYGILQTDLHWITIFIICVITNMILGPIIYFLIDKIIHLFFFINWFERFWYKTVEKTQRKIHKYVEKYGEWGLIIFIGIPFPGSGSYSGAIAATLLGMNWKKFLIANAVGVSIAGILVTAIMLTGVNGFQWMVKVV